MSSGRRVAAGLLAVGALGAGLLMWSTVAPGPERKREILKELPEQNTLRMEESRRRNALVMQVLKDAAETEDNITWGPK
ncbi:ubiquinol-cytochrome-c reductase complex assembly factor 3 [Hoplias malabaricus]|uniref:ubiquinol-cytochrome-c reductase complex assembly factor 3 n=1 Tax=Hoplias malabaricus TaxID=27720 RepID=UPI003461B457